MLCGKVPLGVVGLQQAVRCPALDLRGELPAEVDRIDQAVFGGCCEDVGGIAGQQDAASLVAVGLPGVPDKPGQPLRIGHWQVTARTRRALARSSSRVIGALRSAVGSSSLV